MELVDTRDLKSLEGDFVPVQVQPGYHKIMNELQQAESLTLTRILRGLYRDRFIIFIITFLVSLASVIYSFSINNIYRSETYLKLSENPSNYTESSSVMEAAGGLSSLLGISLGGNDKLVLSNIKKIQSRSFLRSLIENDISFLNKLYASKSFDALTKQLKFNSSNYFDSLDEMKNSELVFFKVFEKYKKSLNLDLDQDSGLLLVSFDHVSPIFAKEALDKITNEINLSARKKSLENANKNLFFLNQELANNQNLLVKRNIGNLAEKELNKKMFAEVHTKEFLFEIVEPPFIPEKKIKPNRSLFLFLELFLEF